MICSFAFSLLSDSIECTVRNCMANRKKKSMSIEELYGIVPKKEKPLLVSHSYKYWIMLESYHIQRMYASLTL